MALRIRSVRTKGFAVELVVLPFAGIWLGEDNEFFRGPCAARVGQRGTGGQVFRPVHRYGRGDSALPGETKRVPRSPGSRRDHDRMLNIFRFSRRPLRSRLQLTRKPRTWKMFRSTPPALRNRGNLSAYHFGRNRTVCRRRKVAWRVRLGGVRECLRIPVPAIRCGPGDDELAGLARRQRLPPPRPRPRHACPRRGPPAGYRASPDRHNRPQWLTRLHRSARTFSWKPRPGNASPGPGLISEKALHRYSLMRPNAGNSPGFRLPNPAERFDHQRYGGQARRHCFA